MKNVLNCYIIIKKLNHSYYVKKPPECVINNASQTSSQQEHNMNRSPNNSNSIKSVDVVNQWTPVANYAPEFIDTNLDMPDEMIDPEFFNSIIDCNTQQNFIEDILLANMVTNSGVHNRWGCRIPVKSNWNVNLFDSLLSEYHDREILEFLRYGFPISWEGKDYPVPANTNHLGATRFPEHIDRYLNKEINLGATIGPFRIPPFFGRIGVSPLSSRPKKDSDRRRIILDLSYPFGNSVNDGISEFTYCGQEIRLTYPTIDTLAKRIMSLGPCSMYKRDLARYFRQVPICPLDYSLIGMHWKGMLYFDKMMPMGLRSAAYVCQCITNAIVFVHREMGFWSINYLDDFGSAEKDEVIWDSYHTLGKLLEQLGVKESIEKAVPPCTKMEFLGTLVDSKNMVLSVAPV